MGLGHHLLDDLARRPDVADQAGGLAGGQRHLLPSPTFDLPGHTVERTLGLSWGLIVRSVGITKGLTGSLKSLRAGEVREFTDVVDQARHTALERLMAHARDLGGNAARSTW